MVKNLGSRRRFAGVAVCLPFACLLAACDSPERRYASQTVDCTSGDASCAAPGETSSSVLTAPPNTTDAQALMPSDSASASATAPLPSASALPGSCTGDAECDDGTHCNGVEQCLDGACQPGTAIVCDDSVPCTFDRCDELLADCAFMPDHAACTDAERPLCDPVEGCNATPCESDENCDDGTVCNGEERCNTDTGSCEAGDPIVCNDDVQCTHDACSEVSGECEFERDNSLCDDGAWCNGDEVCRADGCQAGASRTYDDGIPCTVDTCDEVNDRREFIGQPVLLTIDGTTGYGQVTGEPGELFCVSPPCSFSVECGTRIRLNAWTSQTNGYGFRGWSGVNCSDLYGCEFDMEDDVTISAEFEPANVAFITSTTVTGDTGGVAGADAECQARASAAGWSGTFIAWLHTSTTYAGARLSYARGWVRPDGRPVSNSAFETDQGALFYPLILDEYGSLVADAPVRTGWGGTGTPENKCQDWTDASSLYTSISGLNHAVGWTFQNVDWMGCDARSALYCFQVDRTVTVRPFHDAGRIAFVTDAAFYPGGGLDAADSLCQYEAANAGLPGAYYAMLATSTASAASRFIASGSPWMRPDGARITTAEQMFTADHWDTAPNLTADQRIYFGNDIAWSGGTSLTRVGTLDDTCQDWTAASGNGTGGRIPFTDVQGRHYADVLTCDFGYRLTCLQQ